MYKLVNKEVRIYLKGFTEFNAALERFALATSNVTIEAPVMGKVLNTLRIRKLVF